MIYLGSLHQCLKSVSTFHRGVIHRFHEMLNKTVCRPLFNSIGSRPWSCMALVVLISVGAASIAFFTGSFRVVSKMDETIVPKDSYTLQQRKWAASNFHDVQETTVLIHAHGETVLRKEAIDLAWQVEEAYLRSEGLVHCPSLEEKLVASLHTGNNTDNAFTKYGKDGCDFYSPTRFWNNRMEYEEAINRLSGKPTDDLALYLRTKLSSDYFADGSVVLRSHLFGRADVDPLTGLLVSAQSMKAVYQLRTSRDFEKSLAENLAAIRPTLSTTPTATLGHGVWVSVESSNQTQQDIELTSPVVGDLPLVGASVAAMCVFASIAMATKRRPNREGHQCWIPSFDSSLLLGAGATFSVVLSTCTGYSICALCGFPITLLTQALPFVLLGIGLDDAFILVRVFKNTKRSRGVQQSCNDDGNDNTFTVEEGLDALIDSKAVQSITSTTLTDCVAFALGSATTIPAIRWFCVYAVVSVWMDFLFQITFFVALLVIQHGKTTDRNCHGPDDTNAVENQADTEQGTGKDEESSNASITEDASDISRDPTTTNNDNDNDNGIHTNTNTSDETNDSDGTANERQQTFTMKSYGMMLGSNIGIRVMVWIFFVGMAVAGAVMACRVTVHLDLTDWTPPDSQTDRYVYTKRDYFDEPSQRIFRGRLYFHNIDFSDARIRSAMKHYRNAILDLGEDLTVVQEATIAPTDARRSENSCWVNDFESFLDTATDVDGENTAVLTTNMASTNQTIRMQSVHGLSFRETLDSFLADPTYGPRYAKSFVWKKHNDTNDGVEDSLVYRERIDLTIDLDTTLKQVRFLQRQRRVTLDQSLNKNVVDGGPSRMFLDQEAFLGWAHYEALTKDLLFSLSVGLVAVGIVAILFLPSISGVVLSVLVVAAVDVELVGLLYVMGKTINTFSALLIIMSMGLVADYSLHIVHEFVHMDGVNDRCSKTGLALQNMGGSVLLGGFTTFLGIVALAFANGEVFRTFVILFLSMNVLGLAHGLIFLPVALGTVEDVLSVCCKRKEQDGDDDKKDTNDTDVNTDTRTGTGASDYVCDGGEGNTCV